MGNCDGLVSRQAAIDTLCDNCDHVEAVCPHYPCKQYIAIENLPSAQPEPKWIPFTKRELTAEEQEEHPEWCYIMECPLPDDGQEILVSDGRRVWQDEFYVDDDGCYLDSDSDFDGCAWMPKPEPYKEGEDE